MPFTPYTRRTASPINIFSGAPFVVPLSRVILAAPVSSQDKHTPLHLAALKGHAEVAKTLLDAGANVHATDKVSDEDDFREGLSFTYILFT